MHFLSRPIIDSFIISKFILFGKNSYAYRIIINNVIKVRPRNIFEVLKTTEDMCLNVSVKVASLNI